MTTATPMTQDVLNKLSRVCDRLGFPKFFIDDFARYQDGKEWTINGNPIENPAGLFTAWAKVRRHSMIDSGIWRGCKNENWDFTPAVFKGYKRASTPENELYIEALMNKVNKGEPLTDQEKDHADQMGIIAIIEDLKEDEPENLNCTPLRIVCEKCGLIDFSYTQEKDKFCPRCKKRQHFTLFKR